MPNSIPSIPIPLGFRFLRRKAGINPLIINYHLVSDKELPYVKHLYSYRNISTFREDLGFLLKNYTPIDMHQFLGSKRGEADLPKNAVMITFDDGFKEIFEVAAPILKELGIPATFFITTDLIDNKSLHADNKKSLIIERLVEGISGIQLEQFNELSDRYNLVQGDPAERLKRIPYGHRGILDELADLLELNFSRFLESRKPYVTSDQIAQMIEDGFTIGGHGTDHARFSDLSVENQVLQATTSVEILVNKFGLEYRVFAFPYTDHKVTKSFFERTDSDLDATFGTSGLLTDSVTTNYQRISVEKQSYPARHTIKFHYLRRLVYKARHNTLITRDN